MSYTAGAAQYRELGGITITFKKLDVIHLMSILDFAILFCYTYTIK